MNKKTLFEYKCTKQILRDLNKTLLNARNICTQCHINSLARTESFWVFCPGFSSLINNISNIKQIGVQIKPVFQSKKISQVLAPKEKKPPIVNNQCVVYKFQCDLCDTDYVGYTTRDTCTNALASINILQLEDTWKTMAYRSLI